MFIWDSLPMVLSVKKTAEILGVNATVVYSMLKEDNTLPKIKVGKTYKVSREGLRRMIDGISA